jgi:hypothetical protein
MRTPPVSGSSPLPLTLSLSLSAQWGQPVGASFLRPFAPSLSLSCGPRSQVTEPLPRAPLSSLSAPWARPVSSAPFALTVDRRVRTRARRRISRPRRPPTRPAPFLEPRQCPAHNPRHISLSFTLCPHRQPPPPETRARVPGHPARRRPLQATPSSAPM